MLFVGEEENMNLVINSLNSWVECACGLCLYPFACVIATRAELCPSCLLAELKAPIGRMHKPIDYLSTLGDIYDARTYVR